MRMLLNIPCSPFLLRVFCSRCSAVLDLVQIHYHNDPRGSAHVQSDEAPAEPSQERGRFLLVNRSSNFQFLWRWRVVEPNSKKVTRKNHPSQ